MQTRHMKNVSLLTTLKTIITVPRGFIQWGKILLVFLQAT